MSESDELLRKADALLARWRAGAAGPSPPADYPVLTDVVQAMPAAAGAPLRIPPEPGMPALFGIAGAPGAGEIPELESPEPPLLDAALAPPATGVPAVPLAPVEDLPRLPPLEFSSALSAADTESLEERIRARVLAALEPRIEAYLGEPLRARLEGLARQAAAQLAGSAREDIILFIREAVKAAVSRELGSRRDAKRGEG